jgi:hypothetical protein
MQIHIDVTSDFICPWCYIGEKRLTQAIASLPVGIDVQLHWLPFELNPDMPTEGMDRRACRSRKFGSWERSQAMDAQTVLSGKGDGATFAYDAITRTPNTFLAHRVSWLRAAFGDQSYHQAKTLVKIDQDPDTGTATAHFEDGSREAGDLLIGADGGNSAVRQQFWPTTQPTYAGYLAWPGLLPEDAMPPDARDGLHGDFGFANNRGCHILGYLVPGEHNDVRPGRRLYNWVWYRVADQRLLADIMTDRNGRARGYAIPAGWEPDQVALGKLLRRQGSQAGDHLLFQRPPSARVG